MRAGLAIIMGSLGFTDSEIIAIGRCSLRSFEAVFRIRLIYANNKLKITTKNIVMSFKPYTEKLRRKKLEFVRF